MVNLTSNIPAEPAESSTVYVHRHTGVALAAQDGSRDRRARPLSRRGVASVRPVTARQVPVTNIFQILKLEVCARAFPFPFYYFEYIPKAV
eukprot:4935494-Pleurochrysis_carterae.AAC.3